MASARGLAKVSGRSQKHPGPAAWSYRPFRNAPLFSALVRRFFRETLWTVGPLTFGVIGQSRG